MFDMSEAEEDLEALKQKAGSAQADRQRAMVELTESRTALAACQAEMSRVKADLQAAKSNIEARFRELATLAKLLKTAEDDSSAAKDQRSWLLQLYSALDSQPHWWNLMPKAWRLRRQHERLRRMNLFDAKGYVERYPDIAAAGMDPVRHYVLHGMKEGRTR
ncbi:hypothetical protein [Sphingobium estronivorans]|uniref:hypothetical protein n=1 Tax=Sphingobium estronivorans TaxID=1577690 RepID=UPI00123B5244|nr:hypothetical protein [Sphingobium estronivorans]